MREVVYRPPAAPHVVGRYEERTLDEDGKPEPQRWHVRCERCGEEYRGACMTGLVRHHIATFANVHRHAP